MPFFNLISFMIMNFFNRTHFASLFSINIQKNFSLLMSNSSKYDDKKNKYDGAISKKKSSEEEAKKYALSTELKLK